MALGANIKAWREKKGWTTHQLAHKSGTNQSSISRFELGKTRPRPETLRKIATALGAEVSQLEYGSKEFDIVPVGTRRIPILDYIQAGKWTGVAQSFPEEPMGDFTLTSADYSEKAFAMVVRGESMLPDFREGDVITVDPAVSPRPGDYVVAVEAAGDAVFKRYKSVGVNEKGQHVFELRPLNDLYPTMRSDLAAIEIVGTVVEVTRRFHR